MNSFAFYLFTNDTRFPMIRLTHPFHLHGISISNL
ncbi:hypothetical protein [Bacillus sp. NSP9.1]